MLSSLLNASVGGFYGVTDDLTLGFRLPYAWRFDIREPPHLEEGEEGAGVIEQVGDTDGIGDLVLFGQYRFFHEPNKQHAAIQIRVKHQPARLMNAHARGSSPKPTCSLAAAPGMPRSVSPIRTGSRHSRLIPTSSTPSSPKAPRIRNWATSLITISPCLIVSAGALKGCSTPRARGRPGT